MNHVPTAPAARTAPASPAPGLSPGRLRSAPRPTACSGAGHFGAERAGFTPPAARPPRFRLALFPGASPPG